MKILHCVPTGAWYGTEAMAAAMANLQAGEHEVALAWHPGPGFTSSFAASKLDPRVRLLTVPRLGGSRVQAESVRVELGFTPDVVHAHLDAGMRLARDYCRGRVPWVASLHIRFDWRQVAGSDAVIAISPWQLDDVPAAYPGQRHLVQNFVSPCEPATACEIQTLRARLGADDDTFVVGSIGRLELEKGFDILCEAFVEADLPNSRLAILGEGTERARLERYAQRCDGIEVLGYVDGARRLMGAFDLYASAARSEPFGMALLEAMQLGLPIVSSDALGPRDILGPEGVDLVPVGEPSRLARALRSAFERREERRAYDLARFQPERAHAALMRVYEAVARLGPTSAGGPTERSLSAAVARALAQLSYLARGARPKPNR